MPLQAIVIHERLSTWSRHLRPRLSGPSVAWTESRSADDLAHALKGAVVPLVVIDLGESPARRLADLAAARRAAPDGLILVVDPVGRSGLADLARELGATRVVSGPIPPPEVARILSRWITLARQRAEVGGWPGTERSPEPWDLAPGAPQGMSHPVPTRTAPSSS